MNSGVIILIAVTAIMFLVIGGISWLTHNYTLNGIKSKTVGDGQHGVARFATKKEIEDTYEHVIFNVQDWRNGKNLPIEQGLVVGSKIKIGKVTALVDTGDVHCLMIGAAGVGKQHFSVSKP